MNWYKIALKYTKNDIYDIAEENTYPFSSWFNEDDRTYIDFALSSDQIIKQADPDVINILRTNGYEITDYRKGYCVDSYGRSVRIGKAIEDIKRKNIKEIRSKINELYAQLDDKYNLDDPDDKMNEINNLSQQELREETDFRKIKNIFETSRYREYKQSDNFYIVLTQNPQDVANMSTCRRWTSCMNLETGMYAQTVYQELKNGGFVAYLINIDDKNIQEPLARILIKRFDDFEGNSYALPEQKVYGTDFPGFQEAVEAWVDSKQGDMPTGQYYRQGGDYSDTYGYRHFFLNSKYKQNILSWLHRSEQEKTKRTRWVVNDLLYEDFEDATREMKSVDYYNKYNYEIQDLTKFFKTEEEAKKYLKQVEKEDVLYGDDDREIVSELSNNEKWKDYPRYEIRREREISYVPNHRKIAYEAILSSPKGTFSEEELQDIKQILLSETESANETKISFMEKYPEIFTLEDAMSSMSKETLEKHLQTLPKKIQRYIQEIFLIDIKDILAKPFEDLLENHEALFFINFSKEKYKEKIKLISETKNTDNNFVSLVEKTYLNSIKKNLIGHLFPFSTILNEDDFNNLIEATLRYINNVDKSNSNPFYYEGPRKNDLMEKEGKRIQDSLYRELFQSVGDIIKSKNKNKINTRIVDAITYKALSIWNIEDIRDSHVEYFQKMHLTDILSYFNYLKENDSPIILEKYIPLLNSKIEQLNKDGNSIVDHFKNLNFESFNMESVPSEINGFIEVAKYIRNPKNNLGAFYASANLLERIALTIEYMEKSIITILDINDIKNMEKNNERNKNI